MAITDIIRLPQAMNSGVSSAKQATMLSLLGAPSNSYSQECRSTFTNPSLAALVISADVGPFKARGLKPAVESLQAIMERIEQEKPEVYAGLGTAGMLCIRYVRGSTTSISNHSWGTAIDLTLNGQLDNRGDGFTQRGLAEIAPIFNEAGWFWGAGFRTEDAMHFECGDGLIRRWHTDGLFGAERQNAVAPSADTLNLGDRGPEVAALQDALNRHGALLDADGVFGLATRAALMAYQAKNRLAADGVAGPKTFKALGIA